MDGMGRKEPERVGDFPIHPKSKYYTWKLFTRNDIESSSIEVAMWN